MSSQRCDLRVMKWFAFDTASGTIAVSSLEFVRHLVHDF